MPDLDTSRITMVVPDGGLVAIARERGHQLVKGYTPEHDAQDGPQVLIAAAFAYAAQAHDRISEAAGEDLGDMEGPDAYWPWDASTFSATDDELESLAKAGALLAAAYDTAVARRAAARA